MEYLTSSAVKKNCRSIGTVEQFYSLEQIMDLIQKIGGDDSYVGMAMKGVYEVAISNIENDFGDSLAEQARGASSRAEKHLEQCKIFKAEAEEARKQRNLSSCIMKLGRQLRFFRKKSTKRGMMVRPCLDR